MNYILFKELSIFLRDSCLKINYLRIKVFIWKSFSTLIMYLFTYVVFLCFVFRMHHLDTADKKNLAMTEQVIVFYWYIQPVPIQSSKPPRESASLICRIRWGIFFSAWFWAFWAHLLFCQWSDYLSHAIWLDIEFNFFLV